MVENKDDRDIKAKIQAILSDAIPAKRNSTPENSRPSGSPHIVGDHNLVVIQHGSELSMCCGWCRRPLTWFAVGAAIAIPAVAFLLYLLG